MESEGARAGDVTGGGPGLMQAANEGAARATGAEPTRSLGIRVDLPFEQEVTPFVEEVFEHRSFFSRLHHFVLVSIVREDHAVWARGARA